MYTDTPSAADAYAQALSTAPSVDLAAVVAATRESFEPAKLCGPTVAATLAMLARISGSRRVLEVGCYTGYSALAVASVLPPGATLTTIDVDERSNAAARAAFAANGLDDAIRLIAGDAAAVMDDLLASDGRVFDLCFIDADKASYHEYYRRARALVAPGGLIVIDNCFRRGAVYAPARIGDAAVIDAVNRTILADPDVVNVLLPVADGLNVVRVLR
jgi:predicted O-methyltransferase YrrM